MTVDELITLAQQIVDTPVLGASATKLAAGVLALLSTEATPCGFEEPRAVASGSVYLDPQYGRAVLDEPVARWFATAVLRACKAPT